MAREHDACAGRLDRGVAAAGGPAGHRWLPPHGRPPYPGAVEGPRRGPGLRSGGEADLNTATRFQKPTTLAVETARHLREAIIRGEIRAGERLNESRLTKELALSRSPVREALRILEAEGLITLEPHRGAHVRTISDEDLCEIFDVRLMFETHALLHGRARLTGDALLPLRQAVDEARAALAAGAVEPWHQASLRFHDGLVALAGNRHLHRLYEDLKISLRWFQIARIGLPDRPQHYQAEHEAILAALEAGERDRAVALVARHIANLKDALLSPMARRPSAGGPA